jgi:peroxiredoxin Q/BCP
MSLLSAHGIPMLTDHGYSPMFASWALGVLGGSSIGFTVMLGALSDRFGRRPVLATIYAGRILIFSGCSSSATIHRRCCWWPCSAASRWPARLDDLRADRRHLRPLLGQLGLRPDLPRAPDGLGARLVAGRLSLRDHRGYGAAYALACAFLFCAGIVALRIDRGARRLWRPATVPAATLTEAAMLNPGDKAPDFTGRDHTGKTVKLSDFKGKSVVLWFYPKADTPG